jgi:hypothetical protein
MPNIHEPLVLGVPFPVEIVVPGTQFGEGVLEKGFRLCGIIGIPVDVQSGRGVNGRLDHA